MANGLSPELASELEELRARGFQVIGPGPMTPGQTPPTGEPERSLPGAHVQIGDGRRLIEGFGATPDEAVRDALGKLEGFDPTSSVSGS